MEQPYTLQENDTRLKQSALGKAELKAIHQLQIIPLISVQFQQETKAADCLFSSLWGNYEMAGYVRVRSFSHSTWQTCMFLWCTNGSVDLLSHMFN